MTVNTDELRRLLAENNELRAEVARLRGELDAANEDAERLAEDLEDTKGYVGEYFWEKWEYEATLAAHRARTGGTT